MADFVQILVSAIAMGSVYALIALGYTMVYGILKFINFAHSDIFVLGAWVAYTAATLLFSRLNVDLAHPPLWIGAIVLIISMVVCGLTGFLIERFAYKPLRKAPRLNVLITAIGVSLLLQNVGQLPSKSLTAKGDLKLPFGASPQRMPDLLGEATGDNADSRAMWTLNFAPDANGNAQRVVISKIDFAIVVSAVVLMLALEILVFRTKIGMGMRAVSYSFDNAALMGVPVDAIVSFTFVLGSSLAAAAGFLYAIAYPGLNQPAHEVWVLLGLKAFVAAVVGGIGNVRGAVLGGFLIAFIEMFGMRYIDSNLRDVYVFAVLILVLLVKPSGLLGVPVREKV